MSGKLEGKGRVGTSSDKAGDGAINRRNVLLGTSTLVAAATLTSGTLAQRLRQPPRLRPLRREASPTLC